MKFASKKEAKEILDHVKSQGYSQYFGYYNTFAEKRYYLNYYQTLAYFKEMGFTKEDSHIIISALILAGAKFKID